MSLLSFSPTVIGIVALISAVLTFITFLGYWRSRDRRILFISTAFAVHFVKSTIVAFSLQFSLMEHEAVEVVEAVFDLTMVSLLFIPFLMRK